MARLKIVKSISNLLALEREGMTGGFCSLWNTQAASDWAALKFAFTQTLTGWERERGRERNPTENCVYVC